MDRVGGRGSNKDRKMGEGWTGGRGSNKNRKTGEGWAGVEEVGAIRIGRWERDE